LQDQLLDLGRRASRAPVRPRRAVEQAGLALDSEPVDPPVCALTRNTELLRNMRYRSTIVEHSLDQ